MATIVERDCEYDSVLEVEDFGSVSASFYYYEKYNEDTGTDLDTDRRITAITDINLKDGSISNDKWDDLKEALQDSSCLTIEWEYAEVWNNDSFQEIVNKFKD